MEGAMHARAKTFLMAHAHPVQERRQCGMVGIRKRHLDPERWDGDLPQAFREGPLGGAFIGSDEAASPQLDASKVADDRDAGLYTILFLYNVQDR
jgi:hypothetical protein